MKKLISIIAVLSVMAVFLSCAPPTKINQSYDKILKKDYAGAEKILTELLQENPNDPYAMVNMGVVYQLTGRIEEAKTMYKKVIALNPQENLQRDAIDRAGEKSFKGENIDVLEVAKKNLAELE